MIIRSILSTLITSSLTVSLIGISANSSQANSKYTFVCQKNPQGTWTTFAVDSNNNKKQFIKWRSDDFTLAGYPPKTRCQETTNRLNVGFNSGNKYITTGTMNNLPVICMTDKKGGNCTVLLYFLKPGQNAQAILRNLLELVKGNFSGEAMIE